MILDKKNNKSSEFESSPLQFNSEVSLTRKEVSYKNLSEKFIFTDKNFSKQFAHIYAGRLNKMKPRLLHSCSLKWGNHIPIRKLSELSDENGDKCIVIGTLFKCQELKPSILKEIAEENQVTPQPARSNYVSDSDQVILEDELQRIRLIGKIDVNKLTTGIVTALLGFENQDGKFEVEDMCFTGVLKPEMPLPVVENSYIVLLSGLNLGKLDNLMALELLTEWIKGEMGSISDQKIWTSVCRVLVVGNSIYNSHQSFNTGVMSTEADELSNTLTYVKQLDKIFLDLVRTVEVDVMPGEFDPSNHVLPQQPIHHCVFPKASQLNSFNCVTNPYRCNIGGRQILGTSGQPVNDIKTLTDIDEPLNILEKTLLWGHLAPTAPDTLACYPYYNEDPFIITEQPDIYFAGNQSKLDTKLLNLNGCSTRLICVPSFSESQTCVLVNLKTLECIPFTITV